MASLKDILKTALSQKNTVVGKSDESGVKQDKILGNNAKSAKTGKKPQARTSGRGR